MPRWRRRHYRRTSTRGSLDERRSSRDSMSFSSASSSRSGSIETVALDIVVCHGLYTSQTVDSTTKWLEDFLLDYIKDSRVMVFDFNYEGTGEKVLAREGVEKAATDLLNELCEEGDIARQVPIVFIAYDLAGIIVKRALTIANDDDKYQSIAVNTCRLLFFGTPHRAVNLRAWNDQLLEFAFRAAKVNKQQLVTLRAFAAWLDEIAPDLNAVAGCYSVVDIYEENLTSKGTTVSKFAATLDLPSEKQIERTGDLVSICKFSKEDLQLDMIINAIKLEVTRKDEDYIRCLQTLGMLGPPGKAPTELCGSFDWLLTHQKYDSWLGSLKVAFLHLYGQRASWDSDLSIFIFKSLRKPSISSRSVIYYSFDGQDENRNSSAALLTSLTRQLLILRPSFARIRNIFNSMEKQASWTAEEVWILFRSLVFSLDMVEIICVINSLHECDCSRWELLSTLDGLKNNSSIKFRVVFLSSSGPDIVKSLAAWPQIDLDQEAGKQNDVEAFVQQRMHILTERRPMWKEFEDATFSTLYTFSDFLLISQAVDLLGAFKGLSTSESIHNEIIRLPRTLKAFVQSAITKIPKWANTVLLWILHSLRPLKINELAMILAVEDDSPSLDSVEDGSPSLDSVKDRVPKDLSKDIERAFGPLIRIEGGELRIHWEVQQCLKQEFQENNPQTVEARAKAHWSMAKLCMTYISMKEFEDIALSDYITKHRLLHEKHFDLLAYSVQHWHSHYRHIADNSLYSEMVIEFISDKKRMQLWSKLDLELGNPVMRKNLHLAHPLLTHPLHLAARLGFLDVISILLIRSHGNESDIGDPAFALELAARNGHLMVVGQLLDHGIKDTKAVMTALHEACARGSPLMVERLLEDLKNREAIDYPPNLLCYAAQNGYRAVAKSLLQAGAKINALNDGVTPLHLAGSNGQEALVECLLDADADVDALDQNNATPLFGPSENGYNREVMHLLRAGASANKSNDSGLTPLHLAARNGQLLVMKRLLDAGADVRASDVSGVTPLYLASQYGHEKCVQMLLDGHIDLETINKQDLNGNTALKLAAENGYETITQALLEARADVNLAHKSGITPLYASINQGFEAVFELLMKYGANSVVREISGRTCLMAASQKGLVKVVESLINKSTDLDIRDRAGHTALYFAATEGNDEVVRLLLEGSAKASTIKLNMEKPLIQASKGGYEKVVRLLLENRVDVSARDSRGQIALQVATSGNHEAVVQLLLDYSANPDSINSNGSTALHDASENGFESIALLLLKHRANPNIKDFIEWTPLHRAASKGHSSIARYILKHSGDPSKKDEDGWTALHVAAKYSYLEVMQVLIEFGAEMQAQTYLGETPLHFSADKAQAAKWLLDRGVYVDPITESRETPLMRAAANAQPGMVKLFLEYGANPNAHIDDHGMTALLVAIQSGNQEAAQLLLEHEAKANVVSGDGTTTLQMAAANGLKDAVEQLLNHPSVDVNATGGKHHTALQAAITKGFETIASDLVKHGADTTIQDPQGRLALHHSARFGRSWSTLALLASSGAEPNAVDKQGRNILHHAATGGHSHLARPLIKTLDLHKLEKHPLSPTLEPHRLENAFHSSSPSSERNILNVPDVDGWEPLHWACRGNNPKLVILLLEDGADPLLACKYGWTPRHVAHFHGQKALVEVLGRKQKGKKGEKGRRGSEMEIVPISNTLSEGVASRVYCKGCFHNIYGVQFRCEKCENFYFCFKCYWTVEKTHPGHRFARLGKGPLTKPEWVGTEDEEESPGEEEEDEGIEVSSGEDER